MDPKPSGARPAPSLISQLLPDVVAARDLHRRRAWAFGVFAGSVLALGLVYGKDALGVGFAVAFAAIFGARAAWHAWKLSRTGAGEQVAMNVDGLPAAERPAALRRIMWLGGSAAAALSVWSAWGLWSVESGRAERAEVWGPVATVYRHFGFWPAALTCPALGVLIVSSARTKLRKLEAEAAAARPPA
jgi:hypothetical protein